MFKSPIFWALIFVGAVFAFTLGSNIQSIPKGKAIDTFELTDSDGIPVSNKDLLNKTTLIYFGFTFCPDFCPTTLRKISDSITYLSETKRVSTSDIQVWFVSVDPQRDTPEVLKEYANLINPAIRTMSGTETQLDVIKKAFGVVAEKTYPAGTEDGYYLINHTISTMLINRAGELTQRITNSTNLEDMAFFIEKTL